MKEKLHPIKPDDDFIFMQEGHFVKNLLRDTCLATNLCLIIKLSEPATQMIVSNDKLNYSQL